MDKITRFLFAVSMIATVMMGDSWAKGTEVTEAELDLGQQLCAEFGRPHTFAVYNESSGKCVVKLGDICSESWSEDGYQCGPGDGTGGFCWESRCTCRAEYFKITDKSTGERTCVLRRKLGEPCEGDDDSSCKLDLECTGRPRSYGNSRPLPRIGRRRRRAGAGGVCNCRGEWSETDQFCYNDRNCQTELVGFQRVTHPWYYDSLSRQCKCRLDAECQYMNGSFASCPTNSTVNPDANPPCICNEGLVPSWDSRYCVRIRKRGEQCEFPELWVNGNGTRDKCEAGAGLECINRVCGCPLNSDWSPTRGACVIRAGEYCRHAQDACTENTECDVMGRCKCADPFVATPSGQCGLPYGGNCSGSAGPGACFPGTECMDGRCGCRDLTGQFYDRTLSKCVSLVGSPCDTNSSCVATAYCDMVKGTCECDVVTATATPSFQVTQHGARCYQALGFGAECTANQCDISKGLTCAHARSQETGVCTCVDSAMMYNEEKGACLARVGAKCGAYVVPGTCLPKPGTLIESSVCEYYRIACEPGLACKEDSEKLDTEGDQGKICKLA